MKTGAQLQGGNREKNAGTNEEQPRGARERLLHAAAQLFYRNGYHRTGINQIIDEADVAKASFYNHFPSKEDLGLAYVRQRHERWRNALRERVERADVPEEQLEAVFDHLEAFVRQEHFRGCGQLNMAAEFPTGEHRIRAQIRAQKQEMRSYLREVIRDVIPGGAGKEDIQAKTDALYLLYEAALVESQNFGDSWPVQAARQAARQLIV